MFRRLWKWLFGPSKAEREAQIWKKKEDEVFAARVRDAFGNDAAVEELIQRALRE
jgi:hypothetical protein